MMDGCSNVMNTTTQPNSTRPSNIINSFSTPKPVNKFKQSD